MTFTPPTDNLYKFFAISGLLLFITSLTLPAIQDSEETKEKESEVATEIEILRQEVKLIEDSDAAIMRDGRETSLLPITNINLELEKKQTEIETKSELLNFIEDRLDSDYLFFLAAHISGIFFSLLGFSMWYFKLQRYQDRIIKKQAEGSLPVKKD